MIYSKNYGNDINYGSSPGIANKKFNSYLDTSSIKIFLETGTFEGHGVDWALSTKKFKNIMSIEIDEKKYNFCLNKFKNKNVNLFHGNTVDILKIIIPAIKEKTFIYLDAHFDGIYPIVEESEIILNNFYNLDDLIVCIDDERLFSENLKQNIVNIYNSKNFIDVYLNDSIIFCKTNWFLK